MTNINTTRGTEERTVSRLWRTLGAALLAALARLAVTGAAATVLVIILLNEVAAALVYVIATVLALMFACCP